MASKVFFGCDKAGSTFNWNENWKNSNQEHGEILQNFLEISGLHSLP